MEKDIEKDVSVLSGLFSYIITDLKVGNVVGSVKVTAPSQCGSVAIGNLAISSAG